MGFCQSVASRAASRTSIRLSPRKQLSCPYASPFTHHVAFMLEKKAVLPGEHGRLCFSHEHLRVARPALFQSPDRDRSDHWAGQYGSMSCCWFIHSVLLNLHFREFVADTHGTSSCHSALDPALISAAPHYGLLYGSAPATGNF